MFLIGAAPALLILVSRNRLKEPETWTRLKEEGRLPKGSIFAPYIGLIQNTRWRRNLIVGALLATTGVIGLWGIGEYAVDLQSAVFSSYYQGQLPGGVTDAPLWVKTHVEQSKTWAYLLQMLGAAVGMWAFTQFTTAYGRRRAFFVGFSAALVVTFFAYSRMNSPFDAYWMMFLMGAAQFGVFAGFRHLPPGAFPEPAAEHGHFLLL
jgi:hypothetical protein